MKKKIILCENVLQVLLKTHNSQSKAKKNFCQQTITIAFAFFSHSAGLLCKKDKCYWY